MTTSYNAPRLTLAELPPSAVLICSTARLARELRLEHERLQLADGRRRWATLSVQTLSQWLDGLTEAQQLLQALEPAPHRLSSLQERLLWEQVIHDQLADSPAGAELFDVPGMARLAQEAHDLCLRWQIGLQTPGGQGFGQEHSLETRQFLRWQADFDQRCGRLQAMTAARYQSWQQDRLAALPAEALPERIVFAGFDRFQPLEQQLLQRLAERGAQVHELAQGLAGQARVQLGPLADRQAECRAAVAWAAGQLQSRPQARLGIVVPELQALRHLLADLLDDQLQPASLSPDRAEAGRIYNFSLGEPLAQQPLVAIALQLLQLFSRPHAWEQAAWGALLRAPYWSASVQEADARARLEARMRERLPLRFGWPRFLNWLEAETSRRGMALGLPRLLQHCRQTQQFLSALPRRQSPSAWAGTLAGMLAQLGWPGERPLSSYEYQAQAAFTVALQSLAGLDGVLPSCSFATARQQLQRICQESIHQPQTEGQPQIEIMGLLEAAGTPLDALWVMGMNDHLWPPPARPHPLLPAALQRAAGSPNASADVQAAFAATIQRRLLRSAAQVVFSWALQDGERELRPTPLLASVAASAAAIGLQEAPFFPRDLPLAQRQIEARAAAACAADIVALQDEQAPAVLAHETPKGGTALLRAQAICPAWAFYRYRLAARPLEAAVEGLDERSRGSLLHAVLQAYWQTHGEQGSAALQTATEAGLQAAIAQAVALGMEAVERETGLELHPRLAALEAARLQLLLADWLALEASRPVPFQVLACEEAHEVDVAGIQVRLVIDRIDRLEDGRQLILDYKTGRQQNVRSWADERITEPQLPIYAVWPRKRCADDARELPQDGQRTAPDSWLAGVAFARVRREDCAFQGITATAGLLPKVLAITEEKARRTFARQPDWSQLLQHWQHCLAGIATEIRQGQAAVRFGREQDLAYCEVLPLLRLAERRQLMASRHPWAVAPAAPDAGAATAAAGEPT